MPRFVAIRRRTDTFAKATVTVTSTADGEAATAGLAVAAITNTSVAAAPQVGFAELLGDASAFSAAGNATAESEIVMESEGRASESADAGFPYILPIVFGGTSPIEGEAFGTSVIAITNGSDAEAGADAPADFSLLSRGLTVASGFPYTFSILFGGTQSVDRFPYELPIDL